MLFAENTPNIAGLALYGDFKDFEMLYEALHKVVGDEGEHPHYFSARIRVLGVCYDIRHALMGDREYEFVDNGLDEEKKRRMEVLAPDKNLYFKINVLWPEMLFVMIALNSFLQLYANKQAKTKYSYDLFTNAKVSWDNTIAQVRLLQGTVAECLNQTLTEAAYARLLNVMNGSYVYTDRYITQYIDVLNDKFINMDREKRLKNISIFSKRIAERGKEYRELEDFLKEEAKKHSCSISDLRLDIDFPDEIDW